MQNETNKITTLKSENLKSSVNTEGWTTKIAFLTDAPPLAGKGHGCHTLAFNLISHLKPFINVVITRRMRRTLTRDEIKNAAGVDTLFYPDLPFFPQRFEHLKWRIELLLVRCVVGGIARKLKRIGVRRLFACCGADPWFLWIIKTFQSATKLPVDVYLVDDFESSAILNGNPTFAEKAKEWERRILPNVSRVYTISKGFCERIESRIGVKSVWLPIPIPMPEERIQYRQYPYWDNPDKPLEITYLGAINPLYTGAIRDLLDVLDSVNKEAERKVKLTIMSYTEPDVVKRELGESPHYDYFHRLPIDECRRRLENGWLIFMPYTFAKEHSTMVQTSFPSRLAETICRGRPLLVYGPPNASLPRYFREQNAHICVTEKESLREALESAVEFDNPNTIGVYDRIVREYHSPQALAKILGLS